METDIMTILDDLGIEFAEDEDTLNVTLSELDKSKLISLFTALSENAIEYVIVDDVLQITVSDSEEDEEYSEDGELPESASPQQATPESVAMDDLLKGVR